MGAFAALLVGGGIVALIVGGWLKMKAGRIAKVPFVRTGEAPRQSGQVSVQGTVECPQPLISPVTRTPCLYYELKVEGSWKEGDAEKKKDYVHEKVAAAFGLNDGSGMVMIDASKGGDFDMQKTFDETKKEGMFADLKNALGKGQPMMFGSYAFENPPLSKANNFTCTERVFPLPKQAFALGKVAQGVITETGFPPMIVTAKTRDDLLGSATKNAKMAFIGGAASAGVGLVLGVVSTLVG